MTAQPRFHPAVAAGRGLLAALLLVAAAPAGAAGALEGRRVLLLFSYDPAFVTTAPIREGVDAVLAPEGVTVDLEFMDSKRVVDAAGIARFRDLLAHKLATRAPYDAVMVSDDDALDFALAHRASLFRGTPLVFLAVNDVAKAVALNNDPGVTGVVEHVSIADTALLARRLDPAVTEIVAVADGSASARADLRELHAAVPLLARNGLTVRVLSLAEHSFEELAAVLRALASHQAVLRLTAFRDRLGAVQRYDQSLAHLVRHAPVPVYVLRAVGIGGGAAGGKVVDFRAQGREAARLARSILTGVSRTAPPVLRESPNAVILDHRVLERFGIDPAAAPPGSRVVNAPPPLGRVVFVSALVIAVMAGMIVYFWWQVVARRRAERRLSESEARFRTIVEGSRQGVLIHRHRVPRFANEAYARLLGYASPEEILALGDMERIYAPHERERLRGYQEARMRGLPAPAEYDFHAVRKDGTMVVLHNVVHRTTWNGSSATQHNVHDVTERHRAESMLRESEERYRTLVEHAPEALVVLDVDANRFVDANDNALALYGLTREALMQMDPVALSPPLQPDGRTSAEAAAEMVGRALAGEAPVFRWTHRNARGEELPTEIRLVRLPSSGGRLVRGSVTDVSGYQRAQAALEQKSAQLEATLENTDQGISMVDGDLVMVAFNQRFLELLDFPAGLFRPGDPFEKFIRYNAERGEYGEGDVEAQVRERVEFACRFEPHCFVRTRPDGRVLEIRGKPVPGGGFVTSYTDITETHRLSKQLSHQATHDALTELPNRRAFEEQLERALGQAREHGVEHAMCYLDLDQFKVINDTCGHVAGDELLRQLGQTLHAKVRRRDVLARLGGDEFGVLLGECTLAEARRVAGALRAAVEEFRFLWEGKSFRLGVSIGLVPVTAGSGSVTEVLSAADAACYAAKDQGRNRIHLFNEDDAALARRQGEMQWVVRIQHALDEDRLRLDAQPIVPLDGASDEGSHYELLLRMLDDRGRPVSPGQFLPAAERYNLMGRLDRWVVRHAFERLAADPAALEELFACTINLSGQSFSDDEFLGFVVGELERTGVPPEKFVFEVTETAAISNLATATRFMNALKGIGCRFALDDFGSGLSSFGYLKTLPVDFLKIDGMFVKDILDDPIDHAMVKCINEIGHVMGKRTIAEFVENDAVRERLRVIGVDYVQGYGVGRPQPFVTPRAMRRAS